MSPSRTDSPRGSAPLWAALLGALALAATACQRGSGGPQAKAAPQPAAQPQDPNTVELLFTYGSEKRTWIDDVTKTFNDAGHKLKGGKRVHVKAVAVGSGELVDEVLAGRRKSHLLSPASGAFVELGNAESKAKTGKTLFGETRNLVLSPVVIAMWKPMAEALGWPAKQVGWSDIHALARDPKGWERLGAEYKQWGRFRFGHTHPEF